MGMKSALTGGLGCAALLAAGLTATAVPAQSATATWVSGVGDDANPCSRTAPCKTVAGALSKTDEGGIISILDPATLGAFTITKAITIDASTVQGSTSASGVNAILINAGPDDAVVLRGLDTTSYYGNLTSCGVTGRTGVTVQNAGRVLIDGVRIGNVQDAGVRVAPTGSSPTVTIARSSIRNSCGPAVEAVPEPGRTARVDVVDSVLSTSATGVRATAGATVRGIRSTLFGNGTATSASGGGTIDWSDAASQSVGNGAFPGPALGPGSPSGSVRTWVSGTGDDANPCSRTAPCRTFAGAYVKTPSGGTINVLDRASYGQLTMTRGMTVDATGAGGTVNVPSGNGITISVPETEDVVLRGLTIRSNPGGDPTCPYAGTTGVQINSARSVHVERSTVSGFSGSGVAVTPGSSRPRVSLSDSVVSNVCGQAIRVQPGSAQAVPMLLRDTPVLSSGVAVGSTAGATTWTVRSPFVDVTTPTSGAGQVTVFPDIKTVTKPVVVPPPLRNQVPVACKGLPGRLKRGRTVVLLRNTCVTSGGKVVTVAVSGKGRLVKAADGRRSVKVARSKGKVTVTLTAPATTGFRAYLVTKTYRIR